jgi:nucleoside-diphosphate-sugar epimerase
MRNILVTGALGQIGSELVSALSKKSGVVTVVSHDNRQPPAGFSGIFEQADIRDAVAMEAIIKKYNIDTVFHLVSLLSATGEANPNLAWDINMNGLKIILDLAVKYKMRVFWPSSIAAFGPTTPRVKTPQRTVLEPTTIYGATKVAGELLCQYYNKKYGLDVRSLRYPGLISWKTPPGGGTTDYAVAIFYDALAKGSYECFVKKETTLPMMYMDDAIRGTIKLMDAPEKKITVRTSYNMSAISFRADELAAEIKKQLPKLLPTTHSLQPFSVTYKPDHRQKIADSWPKSINDSQARKDWGWKHEFDLKKMVKVMLTELTNIRKHESH